MRADNVGKLLIKLKDETFICELNPKGRNRWWSYVHDAGEEKYGRTTMNTAEYRSIYCCGCNDKVIARLTSGKEIYPHRQDLGILPFWKCDQCGNYVGCHHKTKDRTRPLGVIPTDEIREARKRIHAIVDPLWQQNGRSRKKVYAHISKHMGWKYHTAKIKSVE